jgi:hypothetical protein
MLRTSSGSVVSANIHGCTDPGAVVPDIGAVSRAIWLRRCHGSPWISRKFVTKCSETLSASF